MLRGGMMKGRGDINKGTRDLGEDRTSKGKVVRGDETRYTKSPNKKERWVFGGKEKKR